jgi:DNA-binding transcriptional LysR family regulator
MASKSSAVLDLNDLRLLLHVVEYGGFSAASKALSIPTSTLSQRIAALERAAGTGLLRRTTRSLSLTDAGRALLPHARAVERVGLEAERKLLTLSDDGSAFLRITTSVAIAQFALAPLIPRFLKDHANVKIRVEATNRYVDLIAEGYDLGVRAYATRLKDSSLVQRLVARTPWALAATPKFLNEHRAPTQPPDLKNAAVLHFSVKGETPTWDFTKGGAGAKVALEPVLCSDNMAALKIAALNHAGIVGLPIYILGSSLKEGALVPVLTDWQLRGSAISVLSPPTHQSSPLARSFRDFIAAELPAITDAGVLPVQSRRR